MKSKYFSNDFQNKMRHFTNITFHKLKPLPVLTFSTQTLEILFTSCKFRISFSFYSVVFYYISMHPNIPSHTLQIFQYPPEYLSQHLCTLLIR
jgi:hypothetical protein